jgi:small neutral amino acid transporter SnatA (MarC family)
MEGTFISAVVLLLLVCDPFGNIPIFISALRDVPRERRRLIILRECLIAFLVLTLFAFVGQPFLKLLGLSEISLQIGGAVVLMLVAVRMVFPSPEGVYGQPPGGEPFIVPLAVPALAGPSALATVLLLVSREPTRTWQWVAAIAVVMLVSALVLAFAERLQQVLGERATAAFERLMGLILAAVAVELMLRGIRAFLAGLPGTS